MISIILNGVTFAGVPASTQYVNIYYRLTATADIPANYTTVDTNVQVQSNGLFLVPVQIDNLLPQTSYTVWIKNVCGSFYKRTFVTGDECYTCLDACCVKLNNCLVKL